MAQCLINIHTGPWEALFPVPVVIVKHLDNNNKKAWLPRAAGAPHGWGDAGRAPCSPALLGNPPRLISGLSGGSYIGKKSQLFFLLLRAAMLLITLSSTLSKERRMHGMFCNMSPFLILPTPKEYAVNKAWLFGGMGEFILPCRMQFRIVFAEIWGPQEK